MRVWAALMAVALVSACVEPVVYPSPAPQEQPVPQAVVPASGALVSTQTAAENFVAVVTRVEPVAEQYCRQVRPGAQCDFRIVIDDRPGQPANAFQTEDETGRPLLAFTVALIKDARNRDELAFIMGHEAAHHIAGHIPQQRDSAMAGAVLAGILAQVGGAGQQAITAAQEIGATVGARQFSKDFELQADALGTEIALAAGYDPLRGSAFFDRLPDPGDRFLGTHPANAQRKQTVAATVARLGG